MILVTGGTGLVGSHLLFQLASQSAPVKAIYRDHRKLDLVRRLFSIYAENGEDLFEKIQWIQAELTEVPSLEEAFADVKQVYHCAAMISFDPNDLKSLIEVNELGTANLVNLCIAHNVEKLCYVSSIAAIGKSINGEVVTEDNEWRKTDDNPYSLTKHLAEMEVWRGTQEGVPAVIVNPGIIIGPGFWDNGSGKLFKVAAKGLRYYPPGGSGFVAVEDVVRMMILLMESNIKNERFIAVSDNLSYKELLSDIADNLGRSKPKVAIPNWTLGFLWRLDWFWSLISGNKRKLTKAQVRSLKNRQFYRGDKISEWVKFEYQSLDKCISFVSRIFREENL